MATHYRDIVTPGPGGPLDPKTVGREAMVSFLIDFLFWLNANDDWHIIAPADHELEAEQAARAFIDAGCPEAW